MDQATSAHQSVLRHYSERGEDANLDCRVYVRVGGYRAQAFEGGCLAMHRIPEILSLFEKTPHGERYLHARHLA
jgi:hypothetical protein